jgi:hypothetical protein
MMKTANLPATGWNNQSGIAIGPILFIIAILAILAAAIAAGSGSFTSSTAGSSNRTKAAGLIQVAESLKIGMDRLTIENGGTPSGSSAFTINPSNTTGVYDLFSPTGGGIAPPPASLAATPNSDTWRYLTGQFPGMGTTAVDYIAVLNIVGDVCNEVNNRVGVATSIVPTNLTANAIFGGTTLPATGNNVANLLNVPSELSGKSLGCFGDSAGRYYFYEIIYIQ